MLVAAIFSLLLAFVVAYFAAFEISRYNTAKLMAMHLGGKAVFRPGRSFALRVHAGIEEKVWVVPDDAMAWGSVLSVFAPASGILYLQKGTGPDFRFAIERKTGMFFKSVALNGLKESSFGTAALDEHLRLLTDNPDRAAAYLSSAERRQAILDLFAVGIDRLQAEKKSITAKTVGLSAEDLQPESVERSLQRLRML